MNYSNNVAFINKERNLGKNLVIDQGLRFRVDLEDIIDAELSTSYSINQTRYTQASFAAHDANRIVISLNGKNYFFKKWTKMATFRLQGFDLFNQNTGITRDVFDNQIVDSQITGWPVIFNVHLIWGCRNLRVAYALSVPIWVDHTEMTAHEVRLIF